MTKDTRDEGYYWASVHKERRMSRLVKDLRDGVKMPDGNPPGQKKISEYGSIMESPEVTVYVDVRERNSIILKNLKDKVRVELRQLPVGDFIVSDRVGVERKTIEDFLQSLVDKRLMTQAGQLSRTFERPVLILEGLSDLYTGRNIHPNAIRGALASLAVDYGISIIPSRNEEDTAELIYTLARREQEYEQRPVGLRGEKKPLALPERQQYVVESLPYVSAVLAKRLLEHFGSVEKIMKASEKQLMKVEGIGAGKASEIRKVIRSRYSGK